jgi:hypothetical protein
MAPESIVFRSFLKDVVKEKENEKEEEEEMKGRRRRKGGRGGREGKDSGGNLILFPTLPFSYFLPFLSPHFVSTFSFSPTSFICLSSFSLEPTFPTHFSIPLSGGARSKLSL